MTLATEKGGPHSHGADYRSILWAVGHTTFLVASLLYFVSSAPFLYKIGMLGLGVSYGIDVYRTGFPITTVSEHCMESNLQSSNSHLAEGILLCEKAPYLVLSIGLYLLNPSGGIDQATGCSQWQF